MRRVIVGIFGALILSTIAFAGWLLWPLPSPAFDWREAANSMAASEACSDLGLFLMSVPLVDPDGAEAYLEERALGSRCDYSASIARAEDDEIAIRAAIAESRRLTAEYGDLEDPFGEAYWSWTSNRRLRAEAGAGWFGIPELAAAFRCEQYFRFGSAQDWVYISRYAGDVEGDNQAIGRWQDRRKWCASYAEAQALPLRRSLPDQGRDEKRDGPTALQSLIDYYESYAAIWREG